MKQLARCMLGAWVRSPMAWAGWLRRSLSVVIFVVVCCDEVQFWRWRVGLRVRCGVCVVFVRVCVCAFLRASVGCNGVTMELDIFSCVCVACTFSDLCCASSSLFFSHRLFPTCLFVSFLTYPFVSLVCSFAFFSYYEFVSRWWWCEC